MPTLKSLIPDLETLIAMHPAELGGYVLEVLLSDGKGSGQWHRGNFCLKIKRDYGNHTGAAGVCAEAWAWLDANGLICSRAEGGEGWYMPTRRGVAQNDRLGVQELIDSEQLPSHFLHDSMIANVRPLFLQGRYDTAVFEAFRLLEIAIRGAANLGDDFIGTKVASRAFNPENGPLSDMSAEAGERQALMNLMSGAIGSYKNPQSHRHVGLDATESREMIIMASHLMKIVVSRR